MQAYYCPVDKLANSVQCSFWGYAMIDGQIWEAPTDQFFGLGEVFALVNSFLSIFAKSISNRLPEIWSNPPTVYYPFQSLKIQ